MPERPFYGWYLVVGLGVTTIVSYGITQYLFGVLIVPIHSELGWSRAQISGAYSVGLVIAGLLAFPIGRLIDQHGARWLMVAGSLLGAASLLLLSGATDLWQLYVLWSGGVGLAMALTLYPVTFTVVANWFQRRRGSALGLLTVLGGLSSPIYIPAAGWLVAHLGWRHALVVLAMTALVISLPIHALLVRRRPEDRGLLRDGAPGGDVTVPAVVHGDLLREAVRKPSFWTLTVSNSLSSLAYTTLLVHVVAFLIGRGYDPVVAASLLGITGIASLPGRFGLNLLSERLGPQGLLAFCTALQGVSVFVLLFGTPAAVIAWVVIYGTTFGTISPLRASTNAEHFGRQAYGAITAAQGIPAAIFAGGGAFLAGVLFDQLGGYGLAFGIVGACFVAAAIFVILTPAAPAHQPVLAAAEIPG